MTAEHETREGAIAYDKLSMEVYQEIKGANISRPLVGHAPVEISSLLHKADTKLTRGTLMKLKYVGKAQSIYKEKENYVHI